MRNKDLTRSVVTTLLLMCIVTLLGGCAAGSGEERPVARGRYVEVELPLPEEIMTVNSLTLSENGKLSILGKNQDAEWGRWESWTQGENWWLAASLEQLNGLSVDYITMDEEEQVWLAVTDRDCLLYLQEEQLVDSGLAKVDGDYLLVEKGDVVIANSVGMVYDVRSENWHMVTESDEYLQDGSFFMTADRYGVATKDKLRLIALESGQLSQEIPLQKSSAAYQAVDFYDLNTGRTLVAATPETGIYSYVNSSGIYRVSEDGILHERLIAGDMTSLVRPTVTGQKLLVDDGVYYVYATDKDSYPWQVKKPVLLRYQYDETVVTVADTQLRVYSLTDSPTVREALGLFQREHPEVRVDYEVGVDNSGLISTEDAVRLLTTELLGGRGPDVLILDGLRLADYRAKGVLADLSELLPAELTADLLPGLLATFASDDVQYAIPTRFTVPMILANAEVARQAQDLKWLAGYLHEMASPQLGIAPEELFDLLYDLYGSQWFLADGRLDEEAAATGLEAIKGILARYEMVAAEGIWDTLGDWRVASIGWLDGWIPLYMNHFANLEQLMGPYTVLQEKTGIFTPFAIAGEAKLTPRAIAGIYAGSNHQEVAVEFLCTMLSAQVQGAMLGDGLPVSVTALKASVDQEPNGGFQRYGVSFNDGFEDGLEKSLTIPVYWPEAEYFADFIDTLAELPASPAENSALRQIVKEEAELYFHGSLGLAETVRSLAQKLDLYLAE